MVGVLMALLDYTSLSLRVQPIAGYSRLLRRQTTVIASEEIINKKQNRQIICEQRAQIAIGLATKKSK